MAPRLTSIAKNHRHRIVVFSVQGAADRALLAARNHFVAFLAAFVVSAPGVLQARRLFGLKVGDFAPPASSGVSCAAEVALGTFQALPRLLLKRQQRSERVRFVFESGKAIERGAVVRRGLWCKRHVAIDAHFPSATAAAAKRPLSALDAGEKNYLS